MTLSPNSRSLRNLNDANTKSGWISYYWVNRLILPLCLVVFSIFIYASLMFGFREEPTHANSPLLDISSSVDYYSKQWLHYQADSKGLNLINRLVISDRSDILSDEVDLDSFDPFSVSSGINVWDLYPPRLSCPDVVRIGKVGEGGKWVCGLTHLAKEQSCVMYSFGISTDISFEVEILLTTNCVIHAFDPTVGKLPFNTLSKHVNQSLNDELRSRIHFHKQAMGDLSGSSNFHSFNEQFYDIMHRLNHSFVNLLKVDVEGGEWDIFNQLFEMPMTVEHKGEKSSTLPVGEIMIELHYSKMRDIHNFFTGAKANGFLPFSREINLQPCLAGGKPFATEYSFINPDNFFNHKKKFAVVSKPYTPRWHQPIKAVIYFLTQHVRVNRLAVALRKLYDNLWEEAPYYPVLIFDEDLTAADRKYLQGFVSAMPLTFLPVQFTVPTSLQQSRVHIPERTVCAPDSSTIGYRHMCQFHAFSVHDALAKAGFGDVEYIMRLDDDSLLTYPIGYDVFRFMKENRKLYGYVNTLVDDIKCITGLWENSNLFVNKLRKNSTHTMLRDGTFYDKWPQGLVFYNNFEISHSSIWRDPLWQAYRSYVEELGGIYTLRWGDAPLHTIGVSIIVPKHQVHAFTDIGYRHEPFVNQMPSGLPMPNIDPFLSKDIKCEYYESWVCKVQGEHAANITSMFTGNGYRNISLSDIDSLELLAMIHPNLNANEQHNKLAALSLVDSRERAVIYTFGHRNRELLLGATIQNFFTNYASKHRRPFVIFFSVSGFFNVELVKRAISPEIIPSVHFQPVELPDVSNRPYDPSCCPVDEERQASSIFFRREATKILKGLGFEWFLRIADDSALQQPIDYDFFDTMKRQNKVYGFHQTMLAREECNRDIWRFGADMCRAIKRTIASHPTMKTMGLQECSSLFNEWTPSSVVLTGFEISHYSVWESYICNNIFEAVGEDPLYQHSDLGLPAKAMTSIGSSLLSSRNQSFNWHDASIHTMCVITSLPKDALWHAAGVPYSFRFSTELQTNKTDLRMDLHKYQSRSVAHYDHTFSAQRIGWLGGDMAASVPLPNESDLGKPASKLVWLYGDSIIGMSTATRRVQDYSVMIHNTVGVSLLEEDGEEQLDPMRTIKNQKFYWRTVDREATAEGLLGGTADNGEGAAAAIFEFHSKADCGIRDGLSEESTTATFWPYGGIAVVSREYKEHQQSNGSSYSKLSLTDHVKLVIIGSLVCSREDPRKKGGEAQNDVNLAFQAEAMATVVVENPYDPPDSWQYTHHSLPSTNSALYHWIAISSTDGNRFVYENDPVYILGSYYGDKKEVGSSLSVGHQVMLRIQAHDLIHSRYEGLEVLASSKQRSSEESKESSNAPRWTHMFQRRKHPSEDNIAGGDAKLLSSRKIIVSRRDNEFIYTLPPPSSSSSDSATVPFSLFAPVVAEASLHYDPQKKTWYTVSLGMLEEWIQLCKTSSIAQPWSCSYVADVVNGNPLYSKELMLYAGKAHPDLLSQRFMRQKEGKLSLVLSYVANSIAGTAPLYEPQFKHAYTPKFLHLEEL